jgi:hypothetical protein
MQTSFITLRLFVIYAHTKEIKLTSESMVFIKPHVEQLSARCDIYNIELRWWDNTLVFELLFWYNVSDMQF